jgi:hypothetical protein
MSNAECLRLYLAYHAEMLKLFPLVAWGDGEVRRVVEKWFEEQRRTV